MAPTGPDPLHRGGAVRRARAVLAFGFLFPAVAAANPAPTRFEISGIHPHLAVFNQHGECGTGAVVPWADRLWIVTYGPHFPRGSTDRLYEIDPALNLTAHPGSVGGTPANRMIHAESQQLFIGPYVIDASRRVRVIPPDRMYGRLTGNARHLSDPANLIYYATMEEGFYEVDVHTLEVTELFRDEQLPEGRKAGLPGYHGKGLYSGQGRLIYANNGENSPLARQRPDIPSGALAEWSGGDEPWRVVRRNQFTEVTGPGGILGNARPATDPVWSIGWDHRSLILMALDGGAWHVWRLPKGSHSYDGAHGWNTEWPRIREIGEDDLLLTMHGMFWRFPRAFGAAQSAGIAPRSAYLKVIGDFARWGDRIVMGCDDTAQSEFLNKRRVRGDLAAPGQSQSNLWFVEPARLDGLGPPLGRGAVWLDEPVKAGEPSEAFLFAGFERRMLHLLHEPGQPVTFTLEVDRAGDGRWTELREVVTPASGYAWTVFGPGEKGAWIRVRPSRACARATAFFWMDTGGRQTVEADVAFRGLLEPGEEEGSGGLLHARGEGRGTLGFASTPFRQGWRGPAAFYEMGPDMRLQRTDDPAALSWMEMHVAVPHATVAIDAASVVCADESGRRYRLPKGRLEATGGGPLGAERTAREVCTERDLLNCGGTFFELPAENAGGFARVRPIATHNRQIHDYASWRGLLVLSGVAADAPSDNPHLIRSDDGQVSLWVGAVDDLWRLGKPVGVGGPWKRSAVRAGEPSDPYLMTGYDRKTLTLSHQADRAVRFHVEVDPTGTGQWVGYATMDVPAGDKIVHAFAPGFQAYWLRVTADADVTATAWLNYD